MSDVSIDGLDDVENVCHFPYAELPQKPGFEAYRGRQVSVGEHELNLYTAGTAVDDLDPETDLGLHIWPGTHVMAWLLLQLEGRSALAGKSCLDVGCGSGFVGLLASLAGCQETVLSDCEEKALSLASFNLEANPDVVARDGHTVRVAELAWGSKPVDETEGVFDVVLLSEVLYVAQPRCVPWVLDSNDLASLAFLVQAKLAPDGEAWVTYGNRENCGKQFCDVVQAACLDVEEMPVEDIVPSEILCRPSSRALHRVKVYRLTHRR